MTPLSCACVDTDRIFHVEGIEKFAQVVLHRLRFAADGFENPDELIDDFGLTHEAWSPVNSRLLPTIRTPCARQPEPNPF